MTSNDHKKKKNTFSLGVSSYERQVGVIYLSVPRGMLSYNLSMNHTTLIASAAKNFNYKLTAQLQTAETQS